MATITDECKSGKIARRAALGEPEAHAIEKGKIQADIPGILDHKVVLLTVAGAAAASDCKPCLKKVIPELRNAGITESDITAAMKEGTFSGAYPELGDYILENVCGCEPKSK